MLESIRQIAIIAIAAGVSPVAACIDLSATGKWWRCT